MKKEGLVRQVAQTLENSGYHLIVMQNMHTCVDILARRLGRKLVIKVVHNIDSASKSDAESLRSIAGFMDAEPIILGSVSKNSHLDDSAVYTRFGVRCMSADSLGIVEDGASTFIASKAVGLKVAIDSDRLHYLRGLSKMSRGRLAKEAKTSKDTIYRHERAFGFASAGTVKRIEAVLGGRIRAESSEAPRPRSSAKAVRLAKTKLSAVELQHAPFDMLAKGRNYYELSYEANSRTVAKRAEVFKEIRETFDDNYPFFLSTSRNGKLHGIPVLSKRALAKMRSEEDLLSFVID